MVGASGVLQQQGGTARVALIRIMGGVDFDDNPSYFKCFNNYDVNLKPYFLVKASSSYRIAVLVGGACSRMWLSAASSKE
jgi:hypothetical protein